MAVKSIYTTVLVFDPKNDGKKIVVDNYWSMVKDQETWTEVVSGTETLPNRNISQAWGNEIREIWVRSQFYGYVTHQPRELVSAQLVDKYTVRLIHNYGLYGGGPSYPIYLVLRARAKITSQG